MSRSSYTPCHVPLIIHSLSCPTHHTLPVMSRSSYTPCHVPLITHIFLYMLAINVIPSTTSFAMYLSLFPLDRFLARTALVLLIERWTRQLTSSLVVFVLPKLVFICPSLFIAWRLSPDEVRFLENLVRAKHVENYPLLRCSWILLC